MGRFFAAFGTGDEAGMDELLAPDFTGHGMPAGLGDDAAGMKRWATVMEAGLRDCRFDVGDLVAEGTSDSPWQHRHAPAQ